MPNTYTHLVPDEVRDAIDWMVRNCQMNHYQPGKGFFSPEAEMVRAWLDAIEEEERRGEL